MALYRVGASGATVVAPDGTPLTRLEPGSVVVPGRIETPEDYADYIATMLIGTPHLPPPTYDDKVVKPKR